MQREFECERKYVFFKPIVNEGSDKEAAKLVNCIYLFFFQFGDLLKIIFPDGQDKERTLYLYRVALQLE